MRFWDRFTNLSQHNYQTGQVFVDEKPCTGCRKCVPICPASALEMFQNTEGKRKARMASGADCISCGACTAICQPRAIEIKHFWHIPSGAYQTLGRIQPIGRESFPRVFVPRVFITRGKP